MKRRRRPGAARETRVIVEEAFTIARSLDVKKLMVRMDLPSDRAVVESCIGEETVVWVSEQEAWETEANARPVVTIPEARLSRMSQIELGLLLSVARGHCELDETVVCLSGTAGSGHLDTILVANPKRDLSWLRSKKAVAALPKAATPEFVRLVAMSLRLALEGREGRSIGTIFVLGDPEQLAKHLRQFVLNPFAGHPRRDRSIHDQEFFETIREFAALDGAFVIDPKGVVESAGTHLAAPASRVKLPEGLGARHAAAAAITAATDAVAIAVSCSSSRITVFSGGGAVLTLEKA